MSINAYMNDGPPEEWDTMQLLWPKIATAIFLSPPHMSFLQCDFDKSLTETCNYVTFEARY